MKSKIFIACILAISLFTMNVSFSVKSSPFLSAEAQSSSSSSSIISTILSIISGDQQLFKSPTYPNENLDCGWIKYQLFRKGWGTNPETGEQEYADWPQQEITLFCGESYNLQPYEHLEVKDQKVVKKSDRQECVVFSIGLCTPKTMTCSDWHINCH